MARVPKIADLEDIGNHIFGGFQNSMVGKYITVVVDVGVEWLIVSGSSSSSRVGYNDGGGRRRLWPNISGGGSDEGREAIVGRR